METVYPQALLETPGMVSVFVVVLLLELLSIGYFVVTIAECKILQRRHAAFFREIGGGDMHREKASRIVFWTYVATTIVMTVVTIFLFLFQPHLI